MVMPSKHFKKNTFGQTFNAATGRFTTAAFGNYSFAYSYLANSNLISGMTTANGTAEKVFAYEANRDLPTEIKYQTTGETPALIAKRNYTFDALGRVSARSQTRGNAAARNDSFAYNNRSELTSATLGSDDYAYAFDNIGNRITAEELTDEIAYASNNLNQYTSITKNEETAFIPTFDDDGNQLTVKTSTGIWTVVYNAENRPVTFTQGTTVIACKYDSQGRRVEKKVTANDVVTFWQRYAYRGYLQVAAFNVTLDAETEAEVYTLATTTMWDPMEQTATRPLAFTDHTAATPVTYFYTHDLTKNVCELLSSSGAIVTTYDYTPFGAVTASNSATPNTFMFSSEVYDPETALVYYNYRHYNPLDGRWINRDPIEEQGGWNLYAAQSNLVVSNYDMLGLDWYNPFSWDWTSEKKLLKKIGSGLLEVVTPVGELAASTSTCAVKYTYEYAIYQPISYLIGRNMGEFWRSTILEEWGCGPTGGVMPPKTKEELNKIKNRHFSTGMNPQNNGMHSWHAESNAYLTREMGVLATPIIVLGGIIHETPLDYQSFCAEDYWQGPVNHALDSIGDLVANSVGIGLGALPFIPQESIGSIGNLIHGPGEPDPKFNPKTGRRTPYKEQKDPSPLNAW